MEKHNTKRRYIKALSVIMTLCVLFTLFCGCNLLLPQTSGSKITLTVAQSPIEIQVGQSITLEIVSSDKSAQAQWVSVDEDIATVVGGVVTGVAEGETQILVECGQLTAYCHITVVPVKEETPAPVIPDPSEETPSQPTEPASVVMVLSPTTMEVGDVVQFSAIAPTGYTLKWFSSNGAVATVQDGVVTAIGVGETNISVTAGKATATCAVEVKEKSTTQPDNPTPDNPNPDNPSNPNPDNPSNPSQDDPITPGQPTDPEVPTKDGYRLKWNDEFNGSALDTSKWGYQIGIQDVYGSAVGPYRWGNNELQYYTSNTKNVGVRDGSLYITAVRESYEGNEFTSARILTRNKFSQTYGYFEARIKLPAQAGMWPAFWMLPEPGSAAHTNNVYGGWPNNGEIDIMEARGREPYKVDTTLHFSLNNSHQYRTRSTTMMFPISDWHIYAVEWTSTSMTWYIDGRSVFTLESSVWYNDLLGGSASAPFDQPYYILLNLAVGGQYDQGTVPPAEFTSDSMYVDYVRVWEKL